ncbi:hypothetical protein N431DRAFT_438878 [Stipitochalara longipes BDJ]|nr:hypothetical protein N431DRAFT_438878 [Stipitochalara longipes BDJ]
MTWSSLGTGEDAISLDDNRIRGPLQSGMLSNTDWNLNPFSVSPLEQIPSSTYTNQFTDDGPVLMGQSDFLLGHENQLGVADNDKMAFHSPIQNPLAGNHSSASDNNDCIAGTPPNVHCQSPHDGMELLNLANKDHLAKLPQSVLKQLAKEVAEALRTTKEIDQQKSRESREKAAELLRQEKMLQKATTVLKCEHPGCNTTFRRNSERLRHTREKHTATTKAFFCPVVDCPKGFKHKFHRIDKFRDHLRGQKISSYPWACILPGCSEIAPNKDGLIEHFRQHDILTRRRLDSILRDYGFKELDYLAADYLCSFQDCKFGAHFISSLSNHMAHTHDGPLRQCPIPNCEAVFQSWDMTRTHLARDHNHATKMQFRDELQKLHLGLSESFTCPLCHHEVENMINAYCNGRKICEHYEGHDKQQVFRASKTILDLWSFSLGQPPTVLTLGGWKEISLTTENKLLAFILLSFEAQRALDCSEENFEQAGAKLRASMELTEDGPQN